MKKNIFLLSLLLAAGAFSFADEITTITIATMEWENYTQKDGTGLYFDLWKEIFGPKGIQYKIEYVPFLRSVNGLVNKTYDGATGVYVGEKGVLYPKYHLGIDVFNVAYLKAKNSFLNTNSLAGKKVAWMRGYDLDKNGTVPANVAVTEFDNLTNIFKTLSAERIDYIIDYSAGMELVINELGLKNTVEISQRTIPGAKYYMAFADSPRGKELADIWDAGMDRLFKSGKLKEMFAAYGDAGY